MPLNNGADAQRHLIANFSTVTPAYGAYFIKDEGWSNTTIEDDPDQQRGKMLKIDYEVRNAGAFAGAWLQGTKLAGLEDLGRGKKWTRLSFWVRGDLKAGFPNKVKVEVKDKGFGWKAYTLDGRHKTITEEWQHIEIPVNEMYDVSNWTSALREIVFTFENLVVNKPQGTIYVDHIELVAK